MANVLKRFIRQLDEPLLTEQLRDDFLRVADTAETAETAETADQQTGDEKLESYRQLLANLPAINYNTLRRLVSLTTTNFTIYHSSPLIFSRLDICTLWVTNVRRI